MCVEKGSGERTKALRGRDRERKNASEEQGLAEVGLLAELLSWLKAANKGGIVGIVSCLTMDLMNIC